LLSYIDLGKGEPIVFIHGLGSKKESWRRQYELSKKFRLIIPDLRGHGETELNNNLTIHNFAKDVIKLLDYLDISTAYICGLSLGGIVAQEIYKQRPNMVKGLILANTTSYVPPTAHYLVNKSEKHFQTDYFVEFVAKKSLYNQEYLDEAMDSFLIRDSYIESSKAPIGVSYYHHLMFMNKPVLLIGGDNDTVTPLINLFFIRSFKWDAKMVVFEKCGHLSNIEQSEKFNKAIVDFIK
jgi:pimeloyl-ACP methyl ester carboxylesterase